MHALLQTILGGPGRVALVAAVLVSAGFFFAGQGDRLLAGAFVTVTWSAFFLFAFLTAASLASALGVDVDATVARLDPEEVDRG